MPIVGAPSSADNALRIEAELIDNVSKKLDVIDRDLDDIASKRKLREADAARASASAAKTSTMAWTEFRSMYSTVLDVVRVGQQVWAETGQKFVEYAAQVRDTSRSLGSSTEEASRLIQVADDVGVSYTALTTSLKMAQKDGIDPSIEGLAKLSDQYLALEPGVKRTQFLLDNFGKSGAAMGKLMEQGGAGIREMSGAIDESMILTQEAVDQAREFEIAQDAMNDSWDAFTYKVAPPLVTALTDVINHYRDIATSLEENGYFYTLTHQLSLDDIAAKRELSDAALLAADSEAEFSESLEESGGALSDNKEAVKIAEQALKDYKDMLEEVSKANQDAESFIQSYADFSKNYAESHAEAVSRLQEATAEGDVEAIEKAKAALADLEASWHESTQKMIYDMALAKVSVDGLTDAEFKATQELAVQMGIRTQAQADEAIAAMEKATSIADGIALQEDVMKEKADADAELIRLENEKAIAAGDSTAAIVSGAEEGIGAEGNLAAAVDATTLSLGRQAEAARLTAAAVAMIGSGGGTTTKAKAGSSAKKRDSGGPGVAGEPYLIGVGAQPEAFIPNTNGTFVPNADKVFGGDTTYNIVVNNPVKQTTEASIVSALKKLSYLGVAS